ncbi:MAG: hypothetical protein ISS57_18865 [Anaerolineales bacterium]|nr:hypothetical protein [Anaerolineales bacterium]
MIKKKKFDGVIEAAHYAPNGQIEWVRAYERTGFVFTDWLKLDRPTLVGRLRDGARFYTGQRKAYLGNDFDIAEAVRLEGVEYSEIVVAGEAKGEQDHLEGVPVF